SAEKLCRRRIDNSRLVQEERWFSLLSRWAWTLAERNRVSAFHRDWLGAPRPRRCANPPLPPDRCAKSLHERYRRETLPRADRACRRPAPTLPTAPAQPDARAGHP